MKKRARRSVATERTERPLPAVARWILWAAVLLPPLVFLPTADDPFRLPKLLAAETLGLASLVALALAGRLNDPERWRRARPALLAIAPLVGLATASLLWSDHPAATRRALADLWIGAACLVGWSVGLRDGEQRTLLGALVWPAALLALLAVLQVHDLWHPIAFIQGFEGERTQAGSATGNPSDLAGFLVLALVFLQARLAGGGFTTVSPARPAFRALLATLLALLVYGLLVSQTLVGLVAAAAASAVLWGLTLRLRSTLVALALIVGVGAGSAFAVPAVRARLAEKAGLLTAGDWNGLLSNRLDGWRAATWMLERAPVAGVGFGTYASNYAAAKLDLIAGGRTFGYAQYHHFGNAHNDYLEVGAELGGLGLAALAVALWFLAKAAFARPPSDRALAWAGLTGVAVLALGQFPFETPITAYPAALFLAWLLAAPASIALAPSIAPIRR